MKMTDEDSSLLECFDSKDNNFRSQCDKWLSNLNVIIKKCFQRIRIRKHRKNNTLNVLHSKKEQLKSDIQNGVFEDEDEIINARAKIDELIEEIEEEITNQNLKTINKNASSVEDSDGKFNQVNAWKLKNKLVPKENNDAPTAKRDANGNLISDKDLLEDLYCEFYSQRMKPNPIKKELAEMEKHKEYLYQLRLKLADLDETPDWTMDELNKVLKSLKNNKARDIFGHTYELYKHGGKFLKESLLRMFNQIKNSKEYPKIFTFSCITSIYKGKGSKLDLSNTRGIYNLVKARSILDKMVYNSNYETLDNNMSPSNIGARKGRNVRDHLFVINAILQEVNKNKKDTDIQIYDVKSAFDKLWSNETSNDVFDNGLSGKHFILSSKAN